jgi:alginate O-acetyltransferase complex protein AlgI
MVFSSPVFLFLFLPAVFILYKILPKSIKNYLLITASLLFYAWGEPVFILLMLASVIVNYVTARIIGGCSEKNRNARLWFALSICFNIGMLLVFKYAGFFIDSANKILGLSLAVPVIRLPIGISFYTFQAVSYVFDVYRGENKAQKNFAHVLLYISFFPQLIAGPIVKYHDISKQIESRQETPLKTAEGLMRFTAGLSKKLLIANICGKVADSVFLLAADEVNISVAWIGAIFYSLQIYFDFSGYSDMAIGLGRMFGFNIKENFKYPYAATSIRTFWRRWHISLSTWFKEYLYIPLGGNRKGTARTLFNLVFVFFCTGLWHGANATFIVWGLMHGAFLLLERVGIIKADKLPRPIASLYTLVVVAATFTIFRTDNLSQGFLMITRMFSGFFTNAGIQSFISSTLTIKVIVVGAIGIIGSTPLIKNLYGKLMSSSINDKLIETGRLVLTLALLFICILALSGQTYNPFIYFRF